MTRRKQATLNEIKQVQKLDKEKLVKKKKIWIPKIEKREEEYK